MSPSTPAAPEPEYIQIKEVSPQDLKARLDKGDEIVVVDMRQSWEYQHGHIPGATHMFVNEIPARLNELPKDKDIVFQCWTGNTSLQASAYLIENGWSAERVASLEGGIAGWVQTNGQGSLVIE
ncbi:MAG: rhodanese-like domain-containing protein [Anaerolineales bacterium]|nr:rhodanese-like domain-containing protein [Anaerolineales bacterium]